MPAPELNKLRYGLFIGLFVTAVVLLFVGLFAAIVPMVLIGAILLVGLFLTRHAFMPIQEPKWDP